MYSLAKRWLKEDMTFEGLFLLHMVKLKLMPGRYKEKMASLFNTVFHLFNDEM